MVSKLGALINTDLPEDPAERTSPILGSRFATDDVPLNGGDEPPERGFVRPHSRACSSPDLGDTAFLEPVGRDIGRRSHSDEIMCDPDTPRSEALFMSASPPPAAETQIHDGSPGYVTGRRPSGESGDTLDRLVDKDAEAGSDLGLCGEAEDAGSTQAAGHSVPRTCEQLAPSSSHGTTQPREPKWQQFSHVEIRNTQPLKAVSVPVEPDDETASVKRGNPHYSSHDCGPWQLNGTTLSIDIRKAGRIPVMVGCATYQVADGRLFLTITLDQGGISIPVISEETHITRKPHSRGMRKARKSDDAAVSPGPPRRGPLSLEQKRHVMRLRDEGHTWDYIASRFPGRKKGSIQQIYSQVKRSGKRSGKQAGKTSQYSKRRRPTSNEHHGVEPGELGKTIDVSRLSGNQMTNAAGHPRYFFRARRAKKS